MEAIIGALQKARQIELVSQFLDFIVFVA